jgi:hypothetical protein
MRLDARLTWQAADPAARAAELGRALGLAVEPGGLVPGAWLLRPGAFVLEVRPWVREGPGDEPRPAGRLMLEPVPDGEEAGPPASTARPGVELLGLGWGTVELDRAEAELSMWLGEGPPTPAGDLRDEALAARCRPRLARGLPGAWIVLLEPAAEGRAAGSLARDGEGPIALYLRPSDGLDAWLADARRRGITAGSRREGPFGRQVVLRGPVTGPHLLVTEGREPGPGADPASTIRP